MGELKRAAFADLTNADAADLQQRFAAGVKGGCKSNAHKRDVDAIADRGGYNTWRVSETTRLLEVSSHVLDLVLSY